MFRPGCTQSRGVKRGGISTLRASSKSPKGLLALTWSAIKSYEVKLDENKLPGQSLQYLDPSQSTKRMRILQLCFIAFISTQRAVRTTLDSFLRTAYRLTCWYRTLVSISGESGDVRLSRWLISEGERQHRYFRVLKMIYFQQDYWPCQVTTTAIQWHVWPGPPPLCGLLSAS